MTALSVSVVIVSRHRPAELRKCLLALRFQTYSKFDVVVVGDDGIPPILQGLGLQDHVTFAAFNEPNISKARNIGIELSAGDVIAFIDDDAVAEPTWLERLVAPFENSDVAASGGFVRGRNGISYQWRAEVVDQTGFSESIDVKGTTVLEGSVDRAIKTQGTNCAFRRIPLIELGGFDESIHFYLDETELNLRIAKAGLLTAIVPSAEVQHGFAESARRMASRAPKSLYDDGASQAYLLTKYDQDPSSLDVFAQKQKTRVLRHLVSGGLEPRDILRLLETLQNGFEDGSERVSKKGKFTDTAPASNHFSTHKYASHICLYGHWRNRKPIIEQAKIKAQQGSGVTVFLFSYSSFFQQRWFHEEGFWMQTGGLFGKSVRTDPVFKWYKMQQRVERELKFLKRTREFHSSPPRHIG